MKFENKIGKSFDNLAQRVIYPYIISYPEFEPVKNNDVSESAQKQMYDFMKNTFVTMYNNPEIIGLPIEEDGCFGEGVLYNSNPELNNMMKKFEKKFLDFFNFLFELGFYGEVLDNKLHISKAKKAINKNKQTMLVRLGLECETKEETVIYSNEYPELCVGWNALSICSNAVWDKDITKAIVSQSFARLMFMKCLYADEIVADSRLYNGLEQSGVYLSQLETFLIEKGYTYNSHDGGYTLVKHCANNKDGKFKVLFDWKKKNQLKYYFEIPGFTKLVTNHYDKMDDSLKGLVFSRLNNCYNCGYCTQTGNHQ
ncbi:hypothetical protein, partial [Anaerosporobacter sp.]|uniref:hypothetical protein n=1 Tax=Anaerosporobacter sp. TaxID=1872529 RepID=UPI00286F8351